MIRLTNDAADQILSLMTDEDDLGLRIEVVSGGCSGYQYKFSKANESTINIDDKLFTGEDGETLLYVDPTSAEKLIGSTIDYETSLMKQEFVVTNPNSACCGCGKSIP